MYYKSITYTLCLDPGYLIEQKSNRTQSNDWFRLGSAIEQNRISILLWVQFLKQSNKFELIPCNFVWMVSLDALKLVKHVGYSHYPDLFSTCLLKVRWKGKGKASSDLTFSLRLNFHRPRAYHALWKLSYQTRVQ